MTVIYYSLMASILSLIMVCIFYLMGENIPKKINYVVVYTPSIISIIILILSSSMNTSIDFRDCEFTAKSIKYYPKKVEIIEDTIIKHREFFTMTYIDNNNDLCEFEISNETFELFKEIWNKKTIVSKSKEQEIDWDKNPSHALVITRSEPFLNFFKSSLDLYNFYKITDLNATKMGIYGKNRFTTLNNKNISEPRQSLIYGISHSDEIGRKISNISSVDNKFRPVICVWNSNNPLDKNKYLDYQKSFWQGGGDNEVVFCVGINKFRKIVWSGSFSWAETKELEDKVIKESLSPGKYLDLDIYYKSLVDSYTKGLWNPKNFEDYTFLKIPFTKINIIISIIVILINLKIHMTIRKSRKKK